MSRRVASLLQKSFSAENCRSDQSTMETNITEPQYLAEESPHFDEEATMASARPVVPLDDIKAESTSRRRLVLGFSLLASLIVGALGASMVFKLRNNKPAAAIMDTAIAGSGAKMEGGVANGTAAGATLENVAAVEPKPEPETRVTESVTPIPALRKARTNNTARLDNEELRRIDRIEAKRARRAEREAEREAWHRRRSGDDLIRIREIFEGTRRP
jgi:hypothetical protein